MNGAVRSFEKRFCYRMTIICQMPMGEIRQVDVPAVDSVTPGLAITKAVINGNAAPDQLDQWHITHAWTTKMIDHGKQGMPFEHARLVAGALGGLPIDWMVKTYAEIQQQWTTNMVPELKQWVRDLK